MNIQLNGQRTELPEGLDLLGLLALRDQASELVAIELNEQMVPRAKREGVILKEGDVVEILRMIAGGVRS